MKRRQYSEVGVKALWATAAYQPEYDPLDRDFPEAMKKHKILRTRQANWAVVA